MIDPPDWAARRLLISAYLYYVLDSPRMSDAEYDRLSLVVSRGWDELAPDRKWALRDPEAIRSTGAHIRFSSFVVAVALNYYKYQTGIVLEVHPDDWRISKRGHRYVTCGSPRPLEV